MEMKIKWLFRSQHDWINIHALNIYRVAFSMCFINDGAVSDHGVKNSHLSCSDVDIERTILTVKFAPHGTKTVCLCPLPGIGQ